MLITDNISIELFLKDIRLSITKLLNIFPFFLGGGVVDRLSPHLYRPIYWSWKELCENMPKTFWALSRSKHWVSDQPNDGFQHFIGRINDREGYTIKIVIFKE